MSLDRSEAVIELGKRLVTQLKISNQDILCSWMAHYVAELINNVEECPDNQEHIELCSQEILNLWKHRTVLPNETRPFSDLEPILRTLVALDVSEKEYHYYYPALREAATADVDEATKGWIDLAIGLDYSARLLIRYALKSAAVKSASEAEPWIKLAQEAGAIEGAEDPVIRFFLDSEDEENESDKKAALEDKIVRLEGFNALSIELISSLKAELETLQS
ncbi:hypothetical protein [Pseudoalteromonas rubra]|uniref:Uncharacterized protein n=1 Tax=Pseudoalteromonas rubra TaxID=43658 RepID=A0A0U3GMA9_9GAMM|nr:hypothetical protein [Pseudoalteromonas rubra]ALU44171.1 hypothetical protein AT705_15160 [Pseudoalteromonas rubra]